MNDGSEYARRSRFRLGSTVTAPLVIAAFVGLNLLYVAFACPFDLSPDEAHYWDWSRNLDYCYYSKGPLVAWLIRGSCEVLGDTPFAVRLPAVLCGGLLLLGLHRLTVRATGDARLGLGVVLVAMTLPPVTAGSVLMTIDPPFLACWVWACCCLVSSRVPPSHGGIVSSRVPPSPGGRGARGEGGVLHLPSLRGGRRAAAGGESSLDSPPRKQGTNHFGAGCDRVPQPYVPCLRGGLTKPEYPLPVAAQPTSPQRGEVFQTAPGGDNAVSLHSPDRPSPLPWRERGTSMAIGWYLAGLLVALGTLAKLTMLLFPACVLGWLVASRHPLARRHVGFFSLSALGLVPLFIWNATHDWLGVRHLLGHGGAGEPIAGPIGVLTLLGGQLGLLGVWFVFWLCASVRFRSDARTAFLWWLSVPVFGLFLLASFRTTGQPNWPLPAYLTGAVLVATWVKVRWHRRAIRVWVWAAVGVGVAAGVVLRYPGVVRPILAWLAPPPTTDRPAPVRQLDPTARLCGWRHLAERVDTFRDRIASETGEEPLLAGMTWVIPGELSFYCRGNPRVYSFGTALADRFSQYDVWRPNPVADAQAFAGRTFIYVGEAIPDGAFRQVELAEAVVAWDNFVPVANWKIWVCRGFLGLPNPTNRDHPIRY